MVMVTGPADCPPLECEPHAEIAMAMTATATTHRALLDRKGRRNIMGAPSLTGRRAGGATGGRTTWMGTAQIRSLLMIRFARLMGSVKTFGLLSARRHPACETRHRASARLLRETGRRMRIVCTYATAGAVELDSGTSERARCGRCG